MEDEGQQETLPVGVDELPPPQESKQQHSGKIQPTKKIDVLLKATGDAPIMKKKRWAVEGEKQVGWVAEFIRKYLKLDQNDSLVCEYGSFQKEGYYRNSLSRNVEMFRFKRR
ncbi:ubiquitin-like protein ATG12 isoform X2 [Portunus trituberculatus]|uniref:ubiquitin-like protein ATG12 isoform X2 n=1 Tax=Portunus trituberculatus TaxID=210409 RepID=UPI001E1CFBE2|nr:ubiquitin-like protein ATG12 isoform X2 [Portunus trituberculatus]